MVKGIFVAWWDMKFDHSHEADVLLDTLLTIREDCLTNLGMADPPNPAAGHYYNVYLHHSGQDGDSLPQWGMGQGTDPYGLPFLTIGYQGYDSDTVVHEGFHIFQYEANSPGFAYSGDSQWYIESSAQWYAASKNPNDIGIFVESGAIIGNPQLALWHSFNNQVTFRAPSGELNVTGHCRLLMTPPVTRAGPAGCTASVSTGCTLSSGTSPTSRGSTGPSSRTDSTLTPSCLPRSTSTPMLVGTVKLELDRNYLLPRRLSHEESLR